MNKRYTAPIPKSVRQSPRWYGPVLLALLILGLLLIVGNYVGIMPAGTSNWYLIGGLRRDRGGGHDGHPVPLIDQ